MRRIDLILWDDENDPLGNEQHIAGHGVTIEEATDVLLHPLQETIGKRSRRPLRLGATEAGRLLYVAFEWIDVATVYPVTAFDAE